jgi:hypothetical protein
MAKGTRKWPVQRKHPAAELKFYRRLGYCIEVDGKQLSSYQWSPVNAWSQADLQPNFPPMNEEAPHGN